MSGVGLTQIGEFSFVLVQVAREAGHVGDDVCSIAILAASLLTILINAWLPMRYVPDWIGALRVRRTAVEQARAAPPPPGARAGVRLGGVGSAVGEALETFALPFTVMDRDPDLIRALRGRVILPLRRRRPATCCARRARRRRLIVAACRGRPGRARRPRR